jgi:hypothetical protein
MVIGRNTKDQANTYGQGVNRISHEGHFRNELLIMKLHFLMQTGLFINEIRWDRLGAV